jgi:hypothetical protein
MSKVNNSMVLISFGNHPTGGGRFGINNASAQMEKFHPGCSTFSNKPSPLVLSTLSENKSKSMSKGKSKSKSLKHFMYWVSTHARPKALYRDESPQVVERFNNQMRSFIESGTCTSDTLFIDVFNMTKSLLQLNSSKKEKEDINTKLTPDGVHWGKNVNMLKTQIILSEMERNSYL